MAVIISRILILLTIFGFFYWVYRIIVRPDLIQRNKGLTCDKCRYEDKGFCLYAGPEPLPLLRTCQSWTQKRDIISKKERKIKERMKPGE